jgi:CheY-like chemotaxis protein
MSERPPVSALPFAGRHILIVEDEMILALDLGDMVKDFGCTSAMVSRVGKAVPLIAAQSFDVAILDLNLAGEPVYPVADELIRRGIPFVFATGYGADGVLPAYRKHPILAKPYSRREVEAALRQVLTPKT